INAINDYIDCMASITIRNLDDNVKKRLRKQAAEHGRSLEAEAREILSRSTGVTEPPPKTGLDLFRGIRNVVEKHGGFELELPEKTPMGALPFEEDAAPFRHEKRKRPKRPPRKLFSLIPM